MSKKPIKELDVRTRSAWRRWLGRNHDSCSEIWLVFHKKHTGVSCVEYGEAVEEALCFGWVDSMLRRLDDDRYARKFTPRRADSVWSESNRRRYSDLKKRGLLAEPGLKRPPTGRTPDAAKYAESGTPAYIAKGLRANQRAWRNFEQLAPSHRRQYIGWIDSAKREETRRRRLREAVKMLASGKKLGLK
jgi:uncharacterized protein YdeI (YjbR/CyaY-like superfamily)